MTHRTPALLVAAIALVTAAAPAAGMLPPGSDDAQTLDPLIEQAGQASQDSRLAEGVAVVGAATDLQLDRAGLDPVPAGTPDTGQAPAHASLDLARQTGLALDAGDRAELARLDDLPASIAAPLSELIHAFATLHAASHDAFASTEPGALPADLGTTPANAWSALDIEPDEALAARAALLDAAVDLDQALRAHDGSVDVDRVHLPPAISIDLDDRARTYEEDIALVVDAGGDDVYHNNAGGTAAEPLGVPGFPAAAVIDFGGADTYGFPDLDPLERRSGANGGGTGGVGLLVDDGPEDDVYAAAADGVNGGAFVGVGLLLDTGGSDTYSAAGWGANGGGYPASLAQLVDLEGDDTYTGSYEAVNGGGALSGSGLLYDGGGHDAYTASFAGTNGGAIGGQGLLLDDGHGDDTYTAETNGVNGGAVAGSGLLYDDGGHDRYVQSDLPDGHDVTRVPKGPAGAQIDG